MGTKRRTANPPTKYSRDYPVTGGHDYFVRSIPLDVWKAAEGRAKREGRSLRHVAIRLLELYGEGALDAAPAPSEEELAPTG